MDAIRKLRDTGDPSVVPYLVDLYASTDNPSIERALENFLKDIKDQNAAKVYVEAYFKMSLMRFDYGTASEAASNAGNVHLLDDLQGNNIYFRVKVVDETDDPESGRHRQDREEVEGEGRDGHVWWSPSGSPTWSGASSRD